MATVHILFGFVKEETESKIVSAIRQKGFDVSFVERETKDSIRAYLEEHAECGCAVLREGMGAESFSAEEFAELTDTRDINIVAIIDRKHKATEYVHTLYAAGITSAIMVTDKKGASPAMIAQLLMKKRTRKSARLYYGMNERKVNLDVLSYESFIYYYTRLLNQDVGINIVDRYISIIKELSPKQAGDFTRKLPSEEKKELCRYEEFHSVLDIMSRQGVNVRVHRPEKLVKGLSDEEYLRALRKDTALIRKNSVAAQQTQDSNESIQQSTQTHVDVNSAVETKKGIVIDNYFYQEAEEEDHPGEPVVQDKKTKEPVKRSTEISSKVNKQKEKKPKFKIKWKYVIYTLVVGILLLLFWYFATAVMMR